MSTPPATQPDQDPPALPDLGTQVAEMKGRAEYIRAQVREIFTNAKLANQPHIWRQALVEVRSMQDTMEEYVSWAISLKGGLGRMAADMRGVYEDAWAGEASITRSRDMEGPRERYAKFDLKVFGPLREHRQAEKNVALAAELLDDMWLRYRAINAVREDIAAIMRGYAFESSLER